MTTSAGLPPPGLLAVALPAAAGSLPTTAATIPPADGSGSTAATEPRHATSPVIDPGDGGDYQPELDPADVVDTIDNPYLPLVPGTRWVYEGETDEGDRTGRGRGARRAP